MPTERISIDPAICHGKPVISGTRVPVFVLLSAIAGGDPLQQVADDYDLTLEDVRAAIAFAAREIAEQSYHVVRH